MATPCLIGKPTGPDAMKAVYCHCDGNPSAMVPVLRRLVLETCDGRPAAAAHYLFGCSGFGYWSSLTGSGVAYSSAMRADTVDGPVHKWTDERWPADVDIYHDHRHCRGAVLEYRDGYYLDSPLLRWGQRWLYIVYPKVLAVVRYVGPTELLGNTLPMGIRCAALPWAQPVSGAQLREMEQRSDRRVDELLATPAASRALAA